MEEAPRLAISIESAEQMTGRTADELRSLGVRSFLIQPEPVEVFDLSEVNEALNHSMRGDAR
jgi:hypothetical protein